MLAVAVAAGRYPDRLDARVQAFGAGVGDRVGEVGQQSRQAGAEKRRLERAAAAADQQAAQLRAQTQK